MTRLADHFAGVMVKRLSDVEVDSAYSNQHEFNGTRRMKECLGLERRVLSARFIYLGRDEGDRISFDDSVTWYDSRENNPLRSEHRLYFHDNDVMTSAHSGDVLVVGLHHDKSLVLIVIDSESEDLPSVLWLFGASENELVEGRLDVDPARVRERSLAIVGQIADLAGIQFEHELGDKWLDQLLARFGNKFPTTRDLSAFALETLGALDLPVRGDPDKTLLDLMDREELLFRQLEKHIVCRQIDDLKDQWATDMDAFVHFSLSVQNRRKSRAGHALENHLEWIFAENDVRFDHGAVTEGRSKPDFLFPCAASYHDSNFPAARLSMLGAKTSCKDRWRQVLNEAARITCKHLLTLQPTISSYQMQEMRKAKLELVVPAQLHDGYSLGQGDTLLSLSEFIFFVKKLNP